MKHRAEWLSALLAVALILGVSAAAQQQSGQTNSQNQEQRQTNPPQDRIQDPPAGVDPLNRQPAQRPDPLGDDWDANETGMFPVYKRHWDARFNTPEYQAFLKQQQRGPTTAIPANPSPGTRVAEPQTPARAQAQMETRDYGFFAETPTRWTNRHDGIFAWRLSDDYWRQSDRYWRDPARRNDPKADAYWRASDEFWRDSDRYWQMQFDAERYRMDIDRRTQLQQRSINRQPTDD